MRLTTTFGLVFVSLLLLVAGVQSFGPGLAGARQPDPTQVPSFGGCIDFSPNACGDDDGDGFLNWTEGQSGSDPSDPNSTPEYGLRDEQTGSRTCRDRVDNDLDGRVDRADSSCRVTCRVFHGGSACSDSDRDGFALYAEVRHGSDPRDPTSTPEGVGVPGSCSDGKDNDLDGDVDDEDLGCGSEIGDCIDFVDPPDCEPL